MDMMKRFAYIMALALVCLSSCRKKPVEIPEPQLPVTLTNTAGDWVLDRWKGADMSRTPVFIRLRNREFTIWQTVGSMYPEKFTGTYNLMEEEGTGFVIRGIYDYSYEFWSHRYVITSLTKKEMTWVSEDDVNDIHIYVRTEEFPE